jgi:hypothetical protein
MTERATARRVLASAILLGALGEIVFGRSALGVNVLVATIALLAAGLVVRPPQAGLDRLDLWLPVGALVFAGFVAIRDDPLLVLADAAIALVLAGASLASFAGIAVTRRTFLGVAELAAWMTILVPTAPASVLRAARLEAPWNAVGNGRSRAWPIIRGLAVGLPLVFIFASLFASADAVFGRWVESLLTFPIDLGDLPGRVLFAGALGWLAAGALWAASRRLPQVAARTLEGGRSLGAAAAARPIALPRAPLTETLTVLVLLDLLFAVFVGLQVAYLFGGLDTLAATGLTYADYARRGFFELVAASALVGLIVLGVEALVARRSRPYIGALIALMALTGVVLASALLRLRLYQDAYGWTELRFYALAMIAFLGLGLGWAIALVLTRRSAWLPHALIVTGLAVSIAVNLVGPQTLVTKQNLERAVRPELVPSFGRVGLDATYLAGLGAGSIPPIVEALPHLPQADRDALLPVLALENERLAGDPSFSGWPAWNLAREQARAALTELLR